MSETEILRAELERLFELPDLLKLSREVLGFEPEGVGGTAAKASFAGALTAHCLEHDAIEALCDALLATRGDVSSKILDLRVTGVVQDEELKAGAELGPYVILHKLGEGRLAISYVAHKDGAEYRVKVLRREATRDQRGLQRYLTVNRLIGQIQHPGLPQQLSAGKFGGRYLVAHREAPGQPLSMRIARSGALHLNEAKPIIRGILEPLAALHERRIAHGDLRLENVIVAPAQRASNRCCWWMRALTACAHAHGWSMVEMSCSRPSARHARFRRSRFEASPRTLRATCIRLAQRCTRC